MQNKFYGIQRTLIEPTSMISLLTYTASGWMPELWGQKLLMKISRIYISSLPESWSLATAPLYNPGMTSVDAIARLQIWHTKYHRNQLTNNTQSTLAL